MPISVRTASTFDVDAIVEVFLGCWRVSYAAVLPPRLVAAMTDEEADALWTRVLGEAAGSAVLVAESGVPGGTLLGVARLAVDEGAAGLVHSLYVAPSAQGRGVGSLLLAAACDALRSAGSLTAHLWVFKDNAPSIAFYRQHGWLPDGQTRIEAAFGEPEIRLTTILARTPSAAEASREAKG